MNLKENQEAIFEGIQKYFKELQDKTSNDTLSLEIERDTYSLYDFRVSIFIYLPEKREKITLLSFFFSVFDDAYEILESLKRTVDSKKITFKNHSEICFPELIDKSIIGLSPIPNFNFDYTQQILDGLNANFDKTILEGLKLKGFTFNNRKATEEFIKARCKKIEYSESKEHIFLVDDIPFLKIDYSPDFKFEENIVSASLGKFTYL
jgi:hypothetical protein